MIKCTCAPPNQRMFTEGKKYPIHDSGPLGLSVHVIDDMGHERVMGGNLRFATGHGVNGYATEYALFEMVSHVEGED